MSKHPFDFVELPADRSTSKPRANGLTMMIDWGLGLVHHPQNSTNPETPGG